MVMKTALIALLGALLCLDRLGPQFMISRPVVAAPLIGLLLGDVATGLLVGAFVELLWVDRPAVGNVVPPNDSLVAITAAGAAILSGICLGGVSRQLIVFSLLVLLPLAYVTQKVETFLMESNNALSDKALEDARSGDAAAVERMHLMGFVKAFLASFLFILIFTASGAAILAFIYPHLPQAALKALELLVLCFPGPDDCRCAELCQTAS